MKKAIYLLFLPLLVISGIVYAYSETKGKPVVQPNPKTISAAEREAAAKAGRKAWEATPDGIKYKEWEASPVGSKVLADAAKISPGANDSTNIEAVITSLTLPPGSRLGFGIMAMIEGSEYILTFEPEKSQLEQMRTLQVNDKITIRPHGVSMAPKYSYAIVSSDYLARDGKLVFKRVPRKGGC